ncbi:hypothetical protein [Janthinobacterium sp. LB3P118]|uniref:hypothetical protein n=1 Tax=Janthinobacterium sp. LB3P118 TaxID=3424195 RepID=UPI003F525CC6
MALAELNAVEQLLSRAGRLDGFPSYHVTVSKITQSSKAHSRLLPAALIDLIQVTTPVFVLQTRNSVTVADTKNSHVSSADMLFASSKTIELISSSSFPRCALIQPGKRTANTSAMLVVATNWRCELVPLPAALASLEEGRTTNAIVFPLSALREIGGRRGRENIVAIWFGLVNKPSSELISLLEGNNKRLNLDVAPMGGGVIGASFNLSNATRVWISVASMLLIVGLGLYIHGIFVPMRCEAALRLCIGQSRATVFSWIQIDVVSQLIAAILLSSTIGVSTVFLLGWSPPLEALWITILGVTLTSALLSFFVCWYVTNKIFSSFNVIGLTK